MNMHKNVPCYFLTLVTSFTKLTASHNNLFSNIFIQNDSKEQVACEGFPPLVESKEPEKEETTGPRPW